jgi:hypothetical protein
MRRLEKIPTGWEVIHKSFEGFNLLELFNKKGETQSSIIYRIGTDDSDEKFLKLISVGSGKNQGRGMYSLLFAGIESMARIEKVNYLTMEINSENSNSLRIHQHYGFFKCGSVSFYPGIRTIIVRKNLSI